MEIAPIKVPTRREMIPWSEATHEQRIERWENVLRVLAKLTRHERRYHFNMGTWGEKTDCGTVLCAGGYCGLDPYFQALGMITKFSKDGELISDVSETSALIMGTEGYAEIFTGYENQYGKVVRKIKSFITRLKAGKISRNDADYDWEEKYDWDMIPKKLPPEEVA